MCHFLTATMAPRGDEGAIRALAESFGIKWIPFENPSVKQSILREGERYYQTTFSGACNCGTLIGSLYRSDEREEVYELSLRRNANKHRKQGWSEAKISRWVEESRSSLRSAADQAEILSKQPDSEVSRWLDFLKDVATGRHASWIGILKHWYKGHLETERFETLKIEWLSAEALNRMTLLHLEDDVLYRVQFTRQT